MDTKTMQSVAMACDWDADQARLGCSGIAPEFLAAIPDPEQIIRCDAMVARLEEIWQEANGDAAKARPAVLALFKAALKDGSEEIRRRFEEDKANGTQVVRAQAYLIDRIVHALMELVVKRVYGEGVRTAGEALTVAAVGGYGRGELAPHSDIDLLFPAALQDDRLPREGGGDGALHAVGPGAEGGAFHPFAGRVRAPGQGRQHGEDGASGMPLAVGRQGAL